MTAHGHPRYVLQDVVARAIRAGEAAYGTLAVDRRQLEAHLADVLERIEGPVTSLALADLFLAFALEAGVAGAWEALLAQHGAALQRMLMARHVPAATAADLVEGLPGVLLAAPRGSQFRTALGDYDGRGSLRAWLAVMVLRAAVREGRARAREADLDPRLQAKQTSDPIDEAAARESASRLTEELRRAWLHLPPRHRIAIAMRFVHGASGAEIAKVLGIGEPRVSRLVDAAVSALRTAVAAAQPDGTSVHHDAVRQQLAAELANLAGSPPPEQHGGDPLAPPR